ncbi:MAG: 16S rRNA (uracil(1498)-N(3))-methyltransferase, partial [Bacteroidaceae bacterium]|nr:16S rRNA (uracil(1498)-N(3))-methyltransferase [Bacteroidaceae bacterium]
MKEERFFYDPLLSGQLPEDEARHAVRVLRLQAGDEIRLMDGRGAFHRAEITLASNHHCLYRILQSEPQERAWA